MNCLLDHLVVAAATLEQGAAWCEATLGVAPGPGGQHALFGTHNRLLKIASEPWPQLYFEIIAIDPEAPAPARPRWFGLDDAALQASLARDGPRLVHAVARSTMLDMHRWGLINVGLKPGDPVRAGRDTPRGRLEWEILVREDGRPECGGALPTLIQWRGPHPADGMPDSAITLRALELAAPGAAFARARDVLRLRGVGFAAAPAPSLRAVLATPKGEVVLQGPGLAEPGTGRGGSA